MKKDNSALVYEIIVASLGLLWMGMTVYYVWQGIEPEKCHPQILNQNYLPDNVCAQQELKKLKEAMEYVGRISETWMGK